MKRRGERIRLQDIGSRVPWCDECAWTPEDANPDDAPIPDDNYPSTATPATARPYFQVGATSTSERSHLWLVEARRSLCTRAKRAILVSYPAWEGAGVDDLGVTLCQQCLTKAGLIELTTVP